VSADIAEMNNLATRVAADSTMSAFLSESARAPSAFRCRRRGSSPVDHPRGRVNRTVVLIDRLLKEVGDDVRRQTAYVSTERGNLNLLSPASRAARSMAPAWSPGDGLGRRNGAGRRPFGRAGRRHCRAAAAGGHPLRQTKRALSAGVYNAVSRVLEQRPDATFDLVAVAPTAGGPPAWRSNQQSRRFAEGVLRSLVEMGLPPNKVAIAGTTSDAANTNEVHIYLR
jgi:phenylpyruvate tautomerase PptA (4-oxalocrotonate tautomerase family)